MHSPRPLRIVAALVTVAILGLAILAQAPRARADANAPRWTAGDFWVYTDTQTNQTVRYDVIARESATTLLNVVYDAFHIRLTATSGSISVTTDQWVREGDLGVVRSSVTILNILLVTTYDPPQSQASFPLTMSKSWTVGSNVSIKLGNNNPTTFSSTFSARVDAELDVSVPAGTFHSFSIRSGTGSYTKLYYSDQAGWWSKQETYDSQGRRTGEQVLTQYRYQWNTTFLAIIGAVIAIIALVVIAFLWRKRKKAVGLPGGPVPPSP
jgi:hypothetical protein